MRMTGAEILIETLIEQGADTIFGYPGGAVLNIYDALYDRRDRIRHFITAHEQGACHAADGYARATGRTGVVFATSGPGATNLVTGIATAFMDSVPIVEDLDSAAAVNRLLHDFGKYIIGRMGLPYRDRNISIICVVLDAPGDVTSSLSGKLGMLRGVSAKTIVAKHGTKKD
jgi:acetolactate synthase-1/2/3 large subunit